MSRVWSRARRLALAAGVCGFAGGLAVPVHAQEAPPTKLFDRLFAPKTAAGGASISVFEGSDTISGSTEALGSQTLAGGTFTGVSPSISYTHPGRVAQAHVSGDSSFRRYDASGESALVGLNANAVVQVVRSRTGLRLQQTVSYAPYYDFLAVSRSVLGFGQALFDQDPAGVSPERAASGRDVTTLNTSADVARQLTRRVTLSARYGLQMYRFGASATPLEREGTPEVTGPVANTQIHSAAVRLSRQVGRNTALALGYETRVALSAQGGRPSRVQDIDLGINRAQMLRLSRYTSMDFSTGSSIVEVTGGHRLYLTGLARVQRDLSRTWTAVLTGQRAVSYLDGLQGSVLNDTVGVSAGGALAPRLELTMGASYAHGLITDSDTGFRLYSGSARLRARVTSYFGLYAEWAQYRHVFDAGTGLPAGVAQRLDRRGLRVGVLINAPLQREAGERGER
ncbi:MAG TPA: hypothetical protein VFX12_00795 [Vicinamibacterales bacterium]|nr:hypothetical protein [Vicinamibacterales bacterium]